jgi:IS5 family transposase
MVSALRVAGAQHDGKTLQATLDAAQRLTDKAVKHCFVDRGYKGHGVTGTEVWTSGQKRGVTASLRRQIKRRSMMEPMIGPMKSEGRLRRNFLKGVVGDEAHILIGSRSWRS